MVIFCAGEAFILKEVLKLISVTLHFILMLKLCTVIKGSLVSVRQSYDLYSEV